MIRRPPRSTLFPYTDALPILSETRRAMIRETGAEPSAAELCRHIYCTLRDGWHYLEALYTAIHGDMGAVPCSAVIGALTPTNNIPVEALHDVAKALQCSQEDLDEAVRLRAVEFSLLPARVQRLLDSGTTAGRPTASVAGLLARSEEHTSELQSRQYLVCRLLLDNNNIVSDL